MKPRELVGLDTEDNGNGDAFLWCFTHATNSWWTRDQSAALTWLEAFGKAAKARGRTVEVWATNLEYDLANLFPPDRVRELRLRFGRSALVAATWKGIEFRDTMRHLPVSVAQWGELVGLPKLEGELFAKRRPSSEREFNRYLSRCKRDSAITRKAAVALDRLYRSIGVRGRSTLASSALHLWQDRYWQGAVYRPRGDVWHAALEAYHGGRTQAFHVGGFKDVTVIDVASMFPWAMVSGAFPLPWGMVRETNDAPQKGNEGIYEVDVDCRVSNPRLPLRTDNGTIYPRGRWRGWYVGAEIDAFRASGGIVLRVRQGFEFLENCVPFARYVREIFRRKQRARGLSRLFYKLMANALYGKFGQQGRVIKALPLEEFLKLPSAPLFWRSWNGLAIWSFEGPPPPWGNNVWAAIVTARARIRLANEMDRLRARGCEPLYCDTDSVIFQGDARYPKKARAIGDFELRGRYREALIVGKKEYALRVSPATWEAHAKGVPQAERMRYLRDGVAEFERPLRIREASRRGESPNAWRRIRKERRIKIATERDGRVTVPLVNAAPDQSRKRGT